MRHVQRVIDRVQIVQIDSVNVLTRSQYLPFFSRLGPYDTRPARPGPRPRPAAAGRVLGPRGEPHPAVDLAAARLPDAARRCTTAWGGMQRVAREHPELVDGGPRRGRRAGPDHRHAALEAALAHDLPAPARRVGLELVAGQERRSSTSSGPARSPAPAGPASSSDGMPRWSRVLPGHLAAEVAGPRGPAAARRRLPGADPDRRPGPRGRHRAVPARLLPAQAGPGPAGARVPRGGRRAACRPRSRAGSARPTCTREARRPRKVHAQALLSPFDSLIWQRDRTAAIFGMDYRLEIYVPAPLRVHGYYVLPFLFGDALVARCRPQGRPSGRGAAGAGRALGAGGPPRRPGPPSTTSWP